MIWNDEAFFINSSFRFRYFGELRSAFTIQPKFGAISMAEWSRQEMPLDGSYVAPLMSIFQVAEGKLEPG
jgi:hypothetical protein